MAKRITQPEPVTQLPDGEPCTNLDCLACIKEPCEVCGRIRGKAPPLFAYQIEGDDGETTTYISATNNQALSLHDIRKREELGHHYNGDNYKGLVVNELDMDEMLPVVNEVGAQEKRSIREWISRQGKAGILCTTEGM